MGLFKRKSMEELKAERSIAAEKLRKETERRKIKADITNIKTAEIRQKFAGVAKVGKYAGKAAGTFGKGLYSLGEQVTRPEELKPGKKTKGEKLNKILGV